MRGTFRNVRNAATARVLLYTVDFLSLLATVLYFRDGFESPLGPPNLGDNYGIRRELRNGSGSFLYFSFVSQRRLDVCLAARHLCF